MRYEQKNMQSSHLRDETFFLWIYQVERISSVIELLLETLADLSDQDFKRFKEVLFEMVIYKDHTDFPSRLLNVADMQDMVFLMVQNYGQQSVKTIKEVLMKMKRTDLVLGLSYGSSGPQSKTIKTKTF